MLDELVLPRLSPLILSKAMIITSVSVYPSGLCRACFEPLSEAVVDSGTSLSVPTPIFPELYEMLRHGVTKVFGEIG